MFGDKSYQIMSIVLTRLFLFFFNVYFFGRARAQVVRGRERGWERVFTVSTVSAEPDAGLNPMNHEIMTKTKSCMLNQPSHISTF